MLHRSFRWRWEPRWQPLNDMAIRINLLSEAQALEEMRRRDPVKRAIWIAVAVGAVVLCWSGYLQAKAVGAKVELSHLESQLRSRTNDYRQVIENKRRLDDANLKLGKLQELATNRFLNGTVLDALQHTTVDDVQLMRVRISHDYLVVEKTENKTNSDGVVLSRGRPASATEKVALTLEARDNSGGEQTIKFRDALASCSYVRSVLGKTNEVKLTSSQPQIVDGRNVVQFTLECRYPEKVR
jgi:hypothetical protein